MNQFLNTLLSQFKLFIEIMKILIRYYSDLLIGNSSTLVIYVDEDLLVLQLKQLIYEQLQIEVCSQKLTTKIANLALVQMTNQFRLSFFHIKDESLIYLENVQDSTEVKYY